MHLVLNIVSLGKWMAKATDIVERWRSYIQPQEDFDEIAKVLEFYGFEVKQGKGSHWVVSHSDLDRERCQELGLRSEFTVCTIKGRKVVKVYVKRILKYIDLLGKENEKID